MGLPIGITMGDPAGIGPEIVVKYFAAGTEAPTLVFGDAAILRRAAAIVGARLDIVEIAHPRAARGRAGTVDLVPTSTLAPDLPFGRVDAGAGRAAFQAIERAIDHAMAGDIAAIVTAPINKQALQAAGIEFPGHTEILADRAGTQNFGMMLANDELRVLLVSIHLSLSRAIAAVTHANELRAIRLADLACRGFGRTKPRIAVAGLNPHAGEGGLFGNEDRDIIAPAIAAARAEGLDASGPWAPDTVFMRARQGEFDIVVAQYHDQGLIPVKYMGVEHGVNVTVGLPFVRTSVDHGTAFDIAGTGKADPASLRAAVRQAVAMSRLRRRTGPPDFICMLTRNDRTVADADARLADALEAGARHIGFKDLGLPFEDLRRLAATARAAGALLYLEVVSLDAEAERRGAEAAVALGADVLMGGTRPQAVLPVIRGTAIKYFPFAGEIHGHPSILKGTIEDIVASARRLTAMDGVHGLDLLAYRFEGDAESLVARVCAAVSKPVIVAGSIDTHERIACVVEAGAAGFTVGTAALDCAFSKNEPFRAQIGRIAATLAGLTAERATRRAG